MKLPNGFDFMNDGDFPVFKSIGKGKLNKDTIYSYDSKNTKRSHVLLFGDVLNKRIIFKYIDRKNFVDYVNKQFKKTNEKGFSLCFQQLSQWKDPYESRFYDADYSLLNSAFDIDKHRKLYACCFAADKDSEPSWKMYVNESNDDDKKVCVQLRINFKALLDYLNYYIANKLNGEYVLVVGRVTYKNKGFINKLHRPDEKGNSYSSYFGGFNFTKYLKLLMLKREAYKYEDEIRMFLIPKEGVTIKDNLVIPVPTVCPTNVKNGQKWGKIVDKIVLDPNSDETEIAKYSQKLSNLGVDIDDYMRSDLYNCFSRIRIGETKEEEANRRGKEDSEKTTLAKSN